MIYLDSSVVFSVQSKDANTLAAVALVQAAPEPLVLTQLCEVEVINALCRRLFLKEISQKQASDSIGDFELNLRNSVYRLLPFPESAFIRAKALAQSLTPTIGVRAANLLHVSAALELGAAYLYTFDQKQRQTALAAGLSVNPAP